MHARQHRIRRYRCHVDAQSLQNIVLKRFIEIAQRQRKLHICYSNRLGGGGQKFGVGLWPALGLRG